ncbi:MAG TPA: hypothetical protein VK633_14665 [Verrucomicrobiae bacterium]|nr:hypothetical protein [Verrucomicrobiae bacterium]
MSPSTSKVTIEVYNIETADKAITRSGRMPSKSMCKVPSGVLRRSQ